ncbi:GntR family transcriptional regulator [Herbidospora sp. NBRC 101105]|uniref:GntR family transcriptional regulator n=1 Tax=Herbidospora sp. NBRC 101105 TaxID=3032195 RepID=UPI0024A0FBAE|nr:GntR family transcriptional regulator [Herbidospora sp. NBRC 101105]GLX94668.1 GntR family transcriptional regulator [Herbidospora sp. NBRC 101105]
MTGSPRTKRDIIVAELRRMISAGELARGSRIRQDVLASQFNTSITPVREALRLLEAEGMLISEPHRGVRVADADYDRVKTVYLLRMAVEPYAMRRASRRLSPKDLDQARKLVEEMEAALAAGDRTTLNEKNRRFHFLFYDRCGNEGLSEEVALLWRRFPWDMLQVVESRGEEAAREHRLILEAARVGDTDALARATEVHLTNSFLALARHLVGHDVPDPFEIDND